MKQTREIYDECGANHLLRQVCPKILMYEIYQDR